MAETLGMPVDKIRRIVTWQPGSSHAVDVLSGEQVALSPKQIATMTEDYKFAFVEGAASYRAMYQPDGNIRWTVVPFERH